MSYSSGSSRMFSQRRAAMRTAGSALFAAVLTLAVLPATAAAAASSHVPGTAGSQGPGSRRTVDPDLLQTFQIQGGYVAAGTGMRDLGYGTITIAGIPSGSTVQAAYLFWDELESVSLNLAQGDFNGTAITGTSIGSGTSPCWPPPNNYAYAADVTAEVSGNGSYSLSNFASGATDGSDPFVSGSPAPEAEGATLVVIYANPTSPTTTIQLYGGASEVGTGAINQTFDDFGTVGSPPSVKTTFIVADGQSAADGGATFNTTALANSEFQGSDPLAVGSYSQGNLWDTETFDVSSLVNAGDTSATAQISSSDDCLVWVGQVLAINGWANGNPGPSQSGVGLGQGLAAVHNPTCSSGQPVNCASGDFWHTFVDAAIPGRGPALNLSRTYNSLSAATKGIFGYGWSSSYDMHLITNRTGR